MSCGYTLLAETFPVARKRHRCIWCGEGILPGEKYRRERSVYDSHMQDHKWHQECDTAFKIELDIWGESEFSPYENERPAKCQNDDVAVHAAQAGQLRLQDIPAPGAIG